jgi:hypothetical protein
MTNLDDIAGITYLSGKGFSIDIREKKIVLTEQDWTIKIDIDNDNFPRKTINLET